MRGIRNLLILLFLAAASPVAVSFLKCPDMGWYADHWPETTSFMRHRMAQAKAKGKPFTPRYSPVPISRISKTLQRTVLIAEDAGFYGHQGFDFEAMKEAYAVNEARNRTARGGSTISQQLAKNLWLTPEKSYWRKVVEAVLTVRMERALSKRRILELYLNVIEWGNGVFGVGEASKLYFGMPPSDLTLPQCALLAGAIPSPRRLNPAKPSEYLLKRQQILMEKMEKVGE